jgi:prepilin-type N-terminal cleavage/methylation domain-containing protein
MSDTHRKALRGRSAFTLTELLVVVTVIAVLGAICIPVYQKATENAYLSKDLSNLRQLGIVMNLYVNDNGFFPGEQWPDSLNPDYVSNWDIFRSPFDKRTPGAEPENAPVSYDINANLWGVSPFQIVSPPDCILLAPLTADQSTLQFIGTADESSVPVPLNRESNGVGTDGGTYLNGTYITALFADLHAAPISMSSFHSSLPNPGSSSSITDIRWNQ